jgi:hypothetical protein
MLGSTEQELTTRAIRAYWIAEKKRLPEYAINQPSSASGTVEHEKKTYVVLRNVNGIMAVYRVRNDGMLKRLRRWPAAVTE